jgi:hypothetical protein
VLKARARELRYVNEETLAVVDDMASPKRYLIDLLTLTPGAPEPEAEPEPEVLPPAIPDYSTVLDAVRRGACLRAVHLAACVMIHRWLTCILANMYTVPDIGHKALCPMSTPHTHVPSTANNTEEEWRSNALSGGCV